MKRIKIKTRCFDFLPRVGTGDFFHQSFTSPSSLFVAHLTAWQQTLASSCWARIRPWTTRSAARWRCGWGWSLRCCRCCASGLQQPAGKRSFNFETVLHNRRSNDRNNLFSNKSTETMALSTLTVSPAGQGTSSFYICIFI